MKPTGHRSRKTLTCARNLQFESTNNIKQNEKSIPVAYTSVWNESAVNERGEIRRVETTLTSSAWADFRRKQTYAFFNALAPITSAKQPLNVSHLPQFSPLQKQLYNPFYVQFVIHALTCCRFCC